MTLAREAYTELLGRMLAADESMRSISPASQPFLDPTSWTWRPAPGRPCLAAKDRKRERFEAERCPTCGVHPSELDEW